jgi:transposase
MARYKDVCYEQDKFIPIRFSSQILPGTFEYTLSYLVEHVIDTLVFDDHYINDETGAPAYDPEVLLKIVCYGYSRGMITSREIARACRENVVFMALSADTQPHYTTIASFIRTMSDVIEPIFRDILLYCDELGLIGREMFAIDGCKLPSNASKGWSGTKAELLKKRQKLERAVRRMLQQQRERDQQEETPALKAKEQQYLKKLRCHIAKLKDWLQTHEDKPGKTGKPVKSNITDNESAKMKTSHGVIQGYDGVAAVDDKRQVVVHAQAYGKAQEHDLLLPMLAGIEANFEALGEKAIVQSTRVTADPGFHTEENLKQLHEQEIDAYVADNRMRKRDLRFVETEQYRARTKREKQHYFGTNQTYRNHDFHYDAAQQTCVCPAGKSLYRSGSNINVKGYLANKFKGTKRDCLPCPLRHKCLKHPDRTQVRQVAFFHGKMDKQKFTFTLRMKEKIDSALGRLVYDKRLGTVEPVFGNHRNHGRDRFTLRGQAKVNVQWNLYSIVHNMGKIHVFGEGFT